MNVLAISAKVENWIRVFRVVNTLLDYGVSVLLCREEVDISETKLPPGTFIIPLKGVFKELRDENSLEAVSPLTEEKILDYIKSEKINPIKGKLTKSINIIHLKSSQVAFYEDSGCFSHAMVLASSGFNVGWVNGRDIVADALDSFDILLSGGGGGAIKANINRENLLLAGMGVDGAKKIATFVKNGGAYFGCCGGSYIGSVVRERFMNWWHPAKRYMTLLNVEDWHIDEFSDSGFKSPGQGVYIARNIAPNNPVMYGMPETFNCIHWNGPIWNIIEGAIEYASSATPLVSFEDVSVEEFTPSEFFRKKESISSEKMKMTGIYKACTLKKTAIAQGYYGLGVVILSGSHPEMATFAGTELERDKLWPSARILSNAVIWSASQSNRKRKKKASRISPKLIYPFLPQKNNLQTMIQNCRKAAETLKKHSLKPLPLWLKPELYTNAYNLTPELRYEIVLRDMPSLCEKTISQLEKLDNLTDRLLKTREIITRKISSLDHDDPKKKIYESLRNSALELVFTYYNMLGTRKPPQWDQGGKQRFQGIRDLLKIAESNTKTAIERLHILEKSDISPVEIINNPFTNLSAASNRLGNALKLLWVNESAMNKFITLWNLFEND